MVKVLFFIETMIGGGAEKVLRNLVNHMDQSKFDITVATLYPEDAEKYLASGIHYKFAYKKKNRINRFRYKIETAMEKTYDLHLKGDYDIEVAFLECGATKIMAGSSNKKAKKFAWVHTDLKNAMANPENFAEATKKWYERFDKVVCVSEKSLQSFQELYGKEIDANIVYNVVDDQEIMNRSKEPLPAKVEKRKPTMLLVGRLTRPKKIERLLSAFKRLKEENLDYDLWIVGEGDERQKLETYIAENDLQESVKLLGFFDNPYPFMETADLLVCSSIYEGFSTFISEGLILGKPIVTTDVSGMRELLGDSEYGLITDNDDEAFYEGLRKMVMDKALLEEYGKKAKQRGKEFSADVLTQKTEAFLLK